MNKSIRFWFRKNLTSIISIGALIVIGIAAVLTHRFWLPQTQQFLDSLTRKVQTEDEEEPVAGAAEDSLHLTPEATRNIGLTTGVIAIEDFPLVVSVPAIIVERPGRSQIEVTAPMNGVVETIYTLERQATKPGEPLFEIRLTHEDIVTAQSEFLMAVQQRKVAGDELKRLETIGENVIAGKRIVEQRYLRDTANASYAALKQSLLLHGLSEEQVLDIETTGQALKQFVVVAPEFASNHEHSDIENQSGTHIYHLQTISVHPGQTVVAGQQLGVLADHCLLYIEGQAFEDDGKRLIAAAQSRTEIAVSPVLEAKHRDGTLKLPIESVADHVDEQSRALKFYLLLQNSLSEGVKDPSEIATNDYVSWEFRPGQRMEVKIPTGSDIKGKFVLPAEAVAIEGPNAFVFEQNGDNFNRIDVHVLHRDKDWVVLEIDPRLVGSTVAMSGAFQMQLALKNQGGGAIDPHAGHNH